MQNDRHVEGRYTAINKAVLDKAGTTVDFRMFGAVAVALTVPVAVIVLTAA